MTKTQAYAAYCETDITPPIKRVGERVRHAFEAGYAQGRAEGIEAAMHVAFEQRCERDTPWDLACVTIATAIRALSQGAGSNEGGEFNRDGESNYSCRVCGRTVTGPHSGCSSSGHVADAISADQPTTLSRQPAPPASEVGALCERLKQLLAKATKGPWRDVPDLAHAGNRRIAGGSFSAVAKIYADEPHARDAKATANATLIVEAVNALPTLLESLSRNGEVERLRVDEDHPLLAPILTLRRANASDFSKTRRQGAEWEAYDTAILDAYHAVEAALQQEHRS